MVGSNTKPITDGYYWWRESDRAAPEVVHVSDGATYRAGREIRIEQVYLEGEWLSDRLLEPD